MLQFMVKIYTLSNINIVFFYLNNVADLFNNEAQNVHTNDLPQKFNSMGSIYVSQQKKNWKKYDKTVYKRTICNVESCKIFNMCNIGWPRARTPMGMIFAAAGGAPAARNRDQMQEESDRPAAGTPSLLGRLSSRNLLLFVIRTGRTAA